MSRREAVVGVDLGTTSSKVLVQDLDSHPLFIGKARTSWTTTSSGGTETTADDLVDLVVHLLRSAVCSAESTVGAVKILGLGVAGIAESGVAVDASGRACTPVVAWFDRRGEQQVADLRRRDQGFARSFTRRTGLPWDSQASVAKLLWFTDEGFPLSSAHRWLSVPEYVVHALGGEAVSEPSLASRTGLLDQATGKPWTDGARALGLPSGLLPPQRRAGEPAGKVSHSELGAAFQGAVLTVAGHDHPVGAIGVGAVGQDELFNSTGTADVIARSLPGRMTDDERERLVGHGVSVGSHSLPDTTLLLGGARGGLLLRRVLGLLGATDAPERDLLDEAALSVGELPAGLQIAGAGPTGNDVVLRMHEGADPATVWAASTRYTASQTRGLLDNIQRVVRPHSRAVASGGWTRMASVRRAKSAVIENLEFSDVSEPGVVGAATLAMEAAALPTFTIRNRSASPV